MNLKKNQIIYCAVAMLLLTTSCQQDRNTLVLDENAPAQSMQNATIHHTESGDLRMVFWGAEIQSFDDEDQTQEFPKGIKATLYNQYGEVASIITADEATNWQKKKLMNLRKNVIINNLRDGSITYTEDFYWNQDKREIYSNVPVLQIDKYGMKQRGSGFRSDDEMQNFDIFNANIDFRLD